MSPRTASGRSAPGSGGSLSSAVGSGPRPCAAAAASSEPRKGRPPPSPPPATCAAGTDEHRGEEARVCLGLASPERRRRRWCGDAESHAAAWTKTNWKPSRARSKTSSRTHTSVTRRSPLRSTSWPVRPPSSAPHLILGESLMADPSASSPAPADEARDPGSPEAARGAPQGANEQEATVPTSEPVREELVQSAVSFLSHPKVVASSDVQRRSFLENKGLTVDEIEEAFRRLLSPPSNSTNSNTCESQGSPDPETATPVVPRHPKSYMEVMEMIQRGEQPDDIQDINDEPPNPDQPISKPRMAPKPKPWEKQGQQSSGWDLKAHSSDPSKPTLGVQTESASQATGSNNSSGHGDLMLMAKPATGSESPADDDATSPKQ